MPKFYISFHGKAGIIVVCIGSYTFERIGLTGY